MNSMSGLRPAGGNIKGNSAGQFRGDIIPKGYKSGQIQQFTPEMMDLFHRMFGHLSPDSDLARLASGDQSMFEQMEAPAWRQFQEAQGQLGSRFSQLAPGAMSAQRGSGFQNAAGQLSSDFAMQLASKRQELQRQALMDMFGLSNSLLSQRPYDRFLEEKPQQQQSSAWGGLLGTGLGAAGGFFAGGPMGALYGANIGYKAGSAF